MADHLRFKDRADAGHRLALALHHLKDEDPVVLALPRGGVPVGWEVAKDLHCPLDVMLVRKIGLPWQPELALGAVVGSDPPEYVINEDVARMAPVPQDYLREERDRQLAEIERRRRVWLAGRPPVDVTGRTAIIVDDGIATGATVRAVLRAVKRRSPKRLVLAVPVAPADTIEALRPEVDEMVVLDTPDPFIAVGYHYKNFEQTTDDEVFSILKES